MGVQGLKYFIEWHHRGCLKDFQLKDCKIFIDGNNLAYVLYKKTPNICAAFGGDYDKFAAHVVFFFSRLQQCNIHPIVLMDGGQPLHNIKLQTSSSRLQSNIKMSIDYNPDVDNTRIVPLHARNVFISVAKRLGLLVLQSDFEADGDIAYLAKKHKAKVISNDSDFFLYDVDYIPLDSLKYIGKKGTVKNVDNAIPCKIFQRNNFYQSLRMKVTDGPLLAVLCGNDCVPPAYLKEFHSYLIGGMKRKSGYSKRHVIIHLVAQFLNKYHHLSEDLVLDQMLIRADEDLRSQIKNLLKHVADGYRPSSSNLSFWIEQHLSRLSPMNLITCDVIEGEKDNNTMQNSNECDCEEMWKGILNELPNVTLPIDVEESDFEDVSDVCSIEEEDPSDVQIEDEDTLELIDNPGAISSTEQETEIEAADHSEDCTNGLSELERLKIISTEEMSKKQKKIHLAIIKRLERDIEKNRKKQKQLEYEKKVHASRQQSQTIKPVDANQILKFIENGFEKEVEFDGFFNKPIINADDSTTNADLKCRHALSNLRTKNGFSLPGWLVYGFRKCLVTRELSDIATNDFCISPVQMEVKEMDSCYCSVEYIIKMIFTMIRGEGSDKNVTDDKLVLSREVVQSKEKGEFRKTRRKGRLTNNFRWYIRDQNSLLCQDFNCKNIYNECKLLPSLKYLEDASVDHRRNIVIGIVIGKEFSESIKKLPIDLQFPMLQMCYWCKNSSTKLEANHILSLLVTFFTFYFIESKIGRRRKNEVQPCVHCLLIEHSVNKPKSILNQIKNMKCYNKKQPYGDFVDAGSKSNKKRKRSKAMNLDINCETDSGEITLPLCLLCEKDSNDLTHQSVEHLISCISSEECTRASDRLGSFHTSVHVRNDDYDRYFVHSMSEYQAVVHYLNLLNGTMLMPMVPVTMDRLWSGPLSYNLFSRLFSYQNKDASLIGLIFGTDSHLWKLFLFLFKIIYEVCGIESQQIDVIVDMDEKQLLQFFLKDLSEKKSKDIKKKNQQKVQELEDEFGMDVDDGCGFHFYSDL